MIQVWLGYPGVGLREYAHWHRGDETVLWQDTFDLEAAPQEKDATVTVMAPFTPEALQSLKGSGISVRVFYPAPEAYNEYEARMVEEQYEAEDIVDLLATMEEQLLELRKSTQARVRHCILGRGERVLGIV